MSSPWKGVGAAMTTPSTPDASTASGLSAILAPNRLETRSARAGTGSLITSSSMAGRPVRVSAWNEPIRPRPSSPIRIVASSFTGLAYRGWPVTASSSRR